MNQDTNEGKEALDSPSSTQRPAVNIRDSGNASTNVIGVQSSSPSSVTRDLEVENRALYQRLAVMEDMLRRMQLSTGVTPIPSAEHPLPHTPAPRSSPSLPEIPPSDRPTPTVARALFREPPPAPTAPTTTVTNPPAPSQLSDLAPVTQRPHQRRVPEPVKFGGTSKERTGARTWLQSARNWLALSAEGESDAIRVMMFATLLQGSAVTWFMNLQTRTEREGGVLTLQGVFNAFVKTYEGGLSQRLGEQRLNSLVYGKGSCHDLNATENEFDRLAQELYPGAEDSPAAIALLAHTYSEIIRKGNEELWEKAMDSQPKTVDEWKAAVQNAYTVMETKRASHGKGRGDRTDMRTSFGSTSASTNRGGVTVRVQQMEDRGESHAETRERQEGEGEENEEELQRAEVRRNQPNPSSRRLGSHLTYDQRTQLMKAGKCWICYQKGHMASECPQKGKAGYPRKPTAEELKA